MNSTFFTPLTISGFQKQNTAPSGSGALNLSYSSSFPFGEVLGWGFTSNSSKDSHPATRLHHHVTCYENIGYPCNNKFCFWQQTYT